jgi:antitoxin component YwqK of YwqJK toxin-antitoxin module
MSRLLRILSALVSLALAACDKAPLPEVEYRDIGKKDDLFVWNGQPFTGVAYTNLPSGLRVQEMPMKHGLFHGVVREWYEDGKPKVETNFVEGKRHGSNQYWFPDGTLMKTQRYENDHPVAEEFFDHGKPITP